jgi:hypothetical protein
MTGATRPCSERAATASAVMLARGAGCALGTAFGTADPKFADLMLMGLLNAACEGGSSNPPTEGSLMSPERGQPSRDRRLGVVCSPIGAASYVPRTSGQYNGDRPAQLPLRSLIPAHDRASSSPPQQGRDRQGQCGHPSSRELPVAAHSARSPLWTTLLTFCGWLRNLTVPHPNGAAP